MHKRLFYLDNLKTFALLLGVLFHTSIVYAPEIGYAIKNPERNYFFSVIVHFIHVFRMPLFFFLSGFFSFMVLNKHGGRNFTFSRFERMFAPMIVGLLFFSPIQYFIVYNQKNNPISFLEYYPLFFTPNEFDLSHIWFLVYLFLKAGWPAWPIHGWGLHLPILLYPSIFLRFLLHCGLPSKVQW